MRDRDQLQSLIKRFEVAAEPDERASAEHGGLIGGNIGPVVENLPPLLEGRAIVDVFRDTESVSSFLDAACAAPTVRLEIGSARGTFALAMATRHPKDLLLASEVRSVLCRSILRKRDRRAIQNLHIMLGDIRLQLPRLVSVEPVFDEIYILFPDPWWKKKHWKRRLFQPGFLEFLGTALKPGGTLVRKTDVEPYKEEVERLGEKCEGYERWTGENETLFLANLPPSRREQELIDANLGIYGLVFSRSKAALPQSADLEP